MTCATTGPIVIKDPKKIRGKSGEDVFSEKKGLGFLKNKVRLAGVFLLFKAQAYPSMNVFIVSESHAMPIQTLTLVCMQFKLLHQAKSWTDTVIPNSEWALSKAVFMCRPFMSGGYLTRGINHFYTLHTVHGLYKMTR